jgi:biopolymer transport protein ExbD
MERNYIAGNECVNFDALVEAIIRRSCIIDYGIVQDVPAEGVVTVSVAVSETTQSMLIMTCVLANIASNSITITAKPNKGDRVLVVYPRIYDENMFTVPSSDTEKTKIIVNRNAKGYNLLSGIAILLNQYKKASHNNVIKFDDGTVDLKLAYKGNKNLLTLTINADGEVAFKTNDSKFSVDLNKDGEATLKSNGITVSTNKDNEVTVTTGKATVKIDKKGNVSIEAQGKYTIKNNSTDLQKVIDGLAQKLEQLTTVGSPATQATSPATLTAISTWRTSILNQFFDVATPPAPEGE